MRIVVYVVEMWYWREHSVSIAFGRSVHWTERFVGAKLGLGSVVFTLYISTSSIDR